MARPLARSIWTATGLLAAVLAALTAPPARTATAQNPALGLVLVARDIGPGYRQNTGMTSGRTLAIVAQGDSPQVRRELARSWIGGQSTAYNGVSVPWGIVSISDVFKPTARMGLILSAWERDLLRITRGRLEPLPKSAPGSGGALVRGRLLTYELLIYMWRRGRTIASVDVTGTMGKVPLALLMRLARLQNAKIGASRFA
jgi:hypothetical protein